MRFSLLSICGALFLLVGAHVLVFAQPTITGFSPSKGKPGNTLTITGTGFSATAANNVVSFGGSIGTVTGASTTQLSVTIPLSALQAPLSVTVGGLTAFADSPFIETFNPTATIGPGSFSATTTELTGLSFPVGIAIGDLDGDGRNDLVVANEGADALTFYRNTTSSPGTITFARGDSSVARYSLLFIITLADIDGDGRPDVIVTSNNYKSVSVYRNTSVLGAISFAPRDTFRVGNGPFGVAAADLNGDGKPDLVVANYYDNTISLLRNTSTIGTLSFDTPVTLSTAAQPRSVSCADLDGDGKPDIAVSCWNGQAISVFLNTTTRGDSVFSFGARLDVQAPGSPSIANASCADLNGDGKCDLIASDSANTVYLFENTSSPGSISFGAGVAFAKGRGIGMAIAADINGDGWPEIVVPDSTDNTVSIFRNNKVAGPITSGSFSAPIAFALTGGTSPLRLVVGDLDGDGHPEVATSDFRSNTVSILRNLIPDGYVRASIKADLQGPFSIAQDIMLNTLKVAGVLGAHFAPVAVPSKAVDSITIELRDVTSPNPAFRRFASAWLLSDGTVRKFGDSTLSYVDFDTVDPGPHYIVVRHRNHLAIMSSSKVSLTASSAPAVYDFTTGLSKAFGGGSPMVLLGTKYCMYSGDSNGSEIVTAADANLVFLNLNAVGYLNADVNLSGIVTAADANIVFINLNIASGVP